MVRVGRLRVVHGTKCLEIEYYYVYIVGYSFGIKEVIGRRYAVTGELALDDNDQKF